MDKTPCQQLKPLIINPSWEKMEDYLADEKTRLVSQLCNCNDLSELKKLQGQLITIEKLLAMKENLKAEEGRRR